MHGKPKTALRALAVVLLACAGSIGCLPLAHADVTDSDFQLHTTSDLLDLCIASPSDPRYQAAIHFCHGYLVGAFQFRREEHASGKQGMSCMFNPPMTRNQAINHFVNWAVEHKEFAAQPAADTFGRYLDTNAPCKG